MKCPVCETEFTPSRPGHKYDKPACRAEAHRSRLKAAQEWATSVLGTKEAARLAERRLARHLPELRRSPALDAKAAVEALKALKRGKARMEILAQGSSADDLPRDAVGSASHYGLAVTLTGSGQPIVSIVVGAPRREKKHERKAPAAARG